MERIVRGGEEVAALQQKFPTVGNGSITMAKATTAPTFVEAFVSGIVSGAVNGAFEMIDAAKAEFGTHVPESKTISEQADAIGDALKKAGYAAKTVANRMTLARKVLRTHTVLRDAIEKAEKSKAWTRGSRGFDQQTVEKLITAASNLERKNKSVPTSAQVLAAFIEAMKPTPPTPAGDKAINAMRALCLNTGTRSAKWKAVIDAAIKEANAQGLDWRPAD